MRPCAAWVVGVWLAAAPADVRASFETVYDAEGRRLEDALLYRALMSQLATANVFPSFPADTTAMRASYEQLDRTVYASYEAQTLLELLSATAADDALDAGATDPRPRRLQRLQSIAGWGLWLMSREAVNYEATAGQAGPWGERKFRGWGKRDFANRSGGFRGWHTFAEQTSVPLIGLVQAAQTIRRFLAAAPEFAKRPVFDASAAQHLRAAGFLQLLPPGLSSADDIDACRANPDCRWDATAVTWGAAADAFEAFAGAVLGWWRANAMSDHGDVRFFGYTADLDAEFAGTGVASRHWFVVHANMLMGRAAYLYGRAAGDPAFVELAAALMGQFVSVHYLCEAGGRSIPCYHYAVKALEWRAWRGAANGRLSPAVVGMTPARSLEEPFHRNASHALVGLLAGGSLLSGPERISPPAFAAGSQRTYLTAYARRRAAEACGFLLPMQCRWAPVQGPPGVGASGAVWRVDVAPEFVPEESLVFGGATLAVPDYRRAQPVAGYYLAEGASDALFERLVLWWDAFGRRNARAADGKPCAPGGLCPSPFSSPNFRKMTVFLAAEAYRRANGAPTAEPRAEDKSGCQSGAAPEILLAAVIAWGARARRHRPR